MCALAQSLSELVIGLPLKQQEEQQPQWDQNHVALSIMMPALTGCNDTKRSKLSMIFSSSTRDEGLSHYHKTVHSIHQAWINLTWLNPGKLAVK